MQGRKPNKSKPKILYLHVAPEMRRYLEQLIPTGLYGKTAPEVAVSLLSRELERIVKDGFLKLSKNGSGEASK
jgi:hypothetical protein